MTFSSNNTKKAYHDIIGYLIGDGSKDGICGINIIEQFQPEDNSRLRSSQKHQCRIFNHSFR